jgi:hypothetical protein
MVDAQLHELRGMFGQAIDSPAVVAFLAKYPNHTVRKPSDGRQYVVAKKHGFDLSFGLSDGSYSGGRTAHLRVLIVVFLHSDAVPRYTTFATPPLGISFDDGHDQLVAKLGPPLSSKAWDTGEMHSARWKHDGIVLSIDYARGEGRVKTVAVVLED